MSVGAQMVVVLKAIVEHCVSLVLGHPFDFSWLEVSQTDVFHPFLLVSCDSESRSSSFCYQIVVRETENRQLFHFFWRRQRNLWVTDTFEWRPEAGLQGALSLSFFSRACPEFVEGAGSDAGAATFARSVQPRWVCVRGSRPPPRTRRHGGNPLCR